MTSERAAEPYSAPSAAPYKALFFTSTLGRGGAEMHLLRLLNHFDRSKFDLRLCLARGGGSYEQLLDREIPVTTFCEPTTSSTWSMARSVTPLRETIGRERPDLVISVMGHANVTALLAQSGRVAGSNRYRPKSVLCLQNPQSILFRHSRKPVERMIGGLIPRLYPRADLLVALSGDVATDIVDWLPSVKEKTVVIPNAGVDDRVVAAAQEPVDIEWPDGPVIVSCGRLTEQKGFSYLIEAIAEVRETVPVNLLIIGEGELRPALERQITQLSLQPYVRLPGFMTNPFAPIARADLFVLPSLWEGFGNVIAEAMACGTPVIATNCPGGPKEIIEPGRSGVLVPPANPRALANAIRSLLADDRLRSSLAAAGKLRSAEYHASTIARRYEEALLGLMQMRAAA